MLTVLHATSNSSLGQTPYQDQLLESISREFWKHNSAFIVSSHKSLTTEVVSTKDKNGKVTKVDEKRSLSLVDSDLDSHLSAYIPVKPFLDNVVQSSVTGINPKYAFELIDRRSIGKWLLRKTDLGLPNPTTSLIDLEYENPILRPSMNTYRNGGVVPFHTVINSIGRSISLEKLLSSSKAKLISIDELKDRSEVLIKFEYEDEMYLVGDQKTGKPVVAPVVFQLILDSEHFFLTKSIQTMMRHKNEVHATTCTHTRQFDTNNRVTQDQEKWVDEVTVNGVSFYSNITERIHNTTYGPVPVEEFTLSHYGFPEPAGVDWNKKSWPTYVYALIVAGVAGILLIIRRRKNTR
ncbi:MAG: hypothetical protein ACRCZF_24925 [Gemmataceae bacterium]